MRTSRPRYDRHRDPTGVGPQIGFAAATFAVFAAWPGLNATVPLDWVMPIIATMLLAFAGGFAVIAWRNPGEDPMRVTYADVAGALTLIGLFAASTIDPDALVRVVEGGQAER